MPMRAFIQFFILLALAFSNESAGIENSSLFEDDDSAITVVESFRQGIVFGRVLISVSGYSLIITSE